MAELLLPGRKRSFAMRTDTIAAIATGMSSAGIGIVRISGSQAFEVADRIFRDKRERPRKLSQEKEWFINKLINIFPTPQKQRKRCMLELSCQKGEYSEEDLIIENKRHIYHESFQKLVKDFYLHL